MDNRSSDGAKIADHNDITLAAFGKQAAIRSMKKETVAFTEIGKTLDALANHPTLRDDVHFAALLTRLAGAQDMDGFHDNAMQIDAYVRRIALAHGVAPNAIVNSGAVRLNEPQMPDHMSDLEETELTRTRLKMR